MKSKNKFTNNFNLSSSIKNISNNISNNFKNNKYINLVIITLIILFSIYLLYFNDKILVQDAITISLITNTNTNTNTNENTDTNTNTNENTNTNTPDSFVENFDVAKYVDVCKNRNTHIYNLGTNNISVAGGKNLNTCETKCNTEDCHIFALNNNTCTTYKGILNTQSKDTRNASLGPIKINCNSKILPNNGLYKTGPYNGIGYINKKYLKNNKTDISYIDTYLEGSVDVLGKLYSLESKRKQIAELDPKSSTYGTQYNNIRDTMKAENTDLFLKFQTLNDDIIDTSIDTDNNRNILYTSRYRNSDITNNVLMPKVPASTTYLDEKDGITKKSNNLGGILDATSENFIVNNLRYLILTVIMIITIIILILYKASNVISEKVLIVYIAIITVLVLFITYYLKL
jgi:hypothetical protein